MKKFLTTLAAGAALAATASAQVTITEIRVDQPSTDNDEFFELTGIGGFSLDGLTYITIGDGSGGSGTVEAVVDLTGSAIPLDGVFLCAESSFTLGAADLTASINFENGDNVTHMLVFNFTGAAGDDLDTDDDGVLDVTPWSMIMDEVAFQETDPAVEGEQLYSDIVVGPDGSFAVATAARETVDGLTAWTLLDFGDLTQNTPGTPNGDPVIPASTGGTQHLFVDAGVSNAANLYVLATTTTGTSPGVPAFGQIVPLNQSTILDYSVQNANGAVFKNTLSFLDGNGTAAARIELPVISPSFVGTVAHTAGIVINPFTLVGTDTVGPVSLAIVP